jgi:uncharacterized protein (DUF4415 family)
LVCKLEASQTIESSEMLRWFKGQGKGYQTLINAVLRAYMEAQGNRKQQNS